MPDATYALTDLETLEVSLVQRGANRKRIALLKSDSEDRMSADFSHILKALEVAAEDEDKFFELISKVEMSEDAKTAIKAALRALSAYKDEIPAEVLAQLSELLGEPAAPKETPEMPMQKSLDPTDLAMVPKEMRPTIEALWKAREEANARAEEAVKKAEETERLLKVERDERREKEFIEKAATALPMIPGTPKDVGTLLKTAFDFDAGFGAKFEKLLKTLNDQVAASSLFEERGSPFSVEGSAHEKIESLANELRKSDPTLSREQSIARVVKTHRDLYAEAQRERKGR